MEIKDNKVLEAAGMYTIAYSLKVYKGDTYRTTLPVTQMSCDSVRSMKEIVTDTYRCSMEQVHLYHTDGSEIVSGSLESNGIATGDTIRAVF